jgi:uncharacterized protein (TIGR03086 family)
LPVPRFTPLLYHDFTIIMVAIEVSVMTTGVETTLERYRRHADAFAALVAGVPPERWDDPSPCAQWTARGVVEHVVAMHGYMLLPLGRNPTPAPDVATDPVAAFRSARADVEQILADPGLASTECDTPGGRMTAAAHIDGVVSDDLVLHGWDLARATGQDDTIDPADLPRLWESATAVPAELMAKFRTPGAFGPGIEVYGPEVPVPAGAPLQDRLLGFIGRDPAWPAS